MIDLHLKKFPKQSFSLPFLAKKYCYVFSRYVVVNKGEKNQDIEKFLWMFNDSENKGYLYVGNLMGRKEENS